MIDDDLGIEGLDHVTMVGSTDVASTYVAWDGRGQRWVSVRVLPDLSPADRSTFERELDAISRLPPHPNVLTPLRFGFSAKGHAYVVSERIDGNSLDDLLQARGPLAWSTAVDYVGPITSGLHLSHQAGVVHRSIDPAIVLVAADHTPRLVYTAVPVQWAPKNGEAAQRAMPFTMAHSPPEAFAPGDHDGLATIGARYDERSDIYSTASMLYTLISGRTPFQADGGDTDAAHITRITLHPVVPLGDQRCPAELDELLVRSLNKEPDRRPQTAQILAAELREIRSRLGSTAPAASPGPTPSLAQRAPNQIGGGATVVARPPGDADHVQRPAHLAGPGVALPSQPQVSPLGGGAAPVAAAPSSAGWMKTFGPQIATGVAAAAVLLTVLGYFALRSGDTGSASIAADTDDPGETGDGDTGNDDGDDGDSDESADADTDAEPDGGEAEGDGAAASSGAVPDEPLRIGTLFPRTGDLSFFGPPMQAGLDLAVEEINAAGGVFDREVEVIQGDSGFDPDVADATVDGFLADDVDAIIGPASSRVSLSVIDKITDAGVIQISPSNTAVDFTTYPDDGLYFRTSPSDSVQAVGLSDLLHRDSNQTAAFIIIDDPYGEGLGPPAMAAFEAAGGQVVVEHVYDPLASDYSDVAAEVAAADPDAVVIVGFSETAAIIEALAAGSGPTGLNLYGTDANMGQFLADELSDPSLIAGMRGTLPGVDVLGSEPNFRVRIDQVNPSLDDYSYTAETYDAAIILALAAVEAQSNDPTEIAAHINDITRTGRKCNSFASCADLIRDGVDIDYDGVSAPLEFSDAGEPTEATILVLEFDSNGQLFVSDALAVDAG